jgi:hypothetical protein
MDTFFLGQEVRGVLYTRLGRDNGMKKLWRRCHGVCPFPLFPFIEGLEKVVCGLTPTEKRGRPGHEGHTFVTNNM